MKSFIVVVCLTVLVGVATPCCLPEKISFDFSLRQNFTTIMRGYGRKSHVQSLNGSGSFDFADQKFYVTVKDESNGFVGKALLDLDQKNGKATIYSKYKQNRENCDAYPIEGEFGKPWQCILDDTSFFMDLGGDYLLDLSPTAYGLITMMSGTCAPTRADVDYIWNTTWAFTTMGFQLEITNVESKIEDDSVFKPSCKAETRKVPATQFEDTAGKVGSTRSKKPPVEDGSCPTTLTTTSSAVKPVAASAGVMAVGTKFRHEWKEEDGQNKWYDGLVLRRRKDKYFVRYEGDPVTYCLKQDEIDEDMKCGSLHISTA